MTQEEWDKYRAAIKAADYEIREAASQRRRAEIQVQEARGRYDAADRIFKETISKAVGIDLWDLEIGSWECKESPIGVCFYDSKSDPCNDFCLVCCSPDERK